MIPLKPIFKSAPIADTRFGPVKGTFDLRRRYTIYRGIPYAAPPLGSLRWRAPQPPEPWDQTLDCRKAGPIAPQRGYSTQFTEAFINQIGVSLPRRTALRLGVKALHRNQSEDCLTLGIRACVNAERAPVMVWIHGGDHADGAGSELLYQTNALPSRGVVQVTFNYRLGLFGFLAHPGLDDESEVNNSGNYGLLDQIAVLEWVRDNIENFGGDPNNVTIFGESAGGQAVLNLMTTPRARGLFHRAIAQSPGDGGRWLHSDQPVLDFEPAPVAGERFAYAAVGNNVNQIGRLRSMTTESLMHLYRKNPEVGRYFYPTVDGAILSETPASTFLHRNQASVPLMIGYNANEGSLLTKMSSPAGPEMRNDTSQTVLTSLTRSYGSRGVARAVMAAYPGLEDLDDVAIADHLRDHTFGVQVDHCAREHSDAGNRTYRYHYRNRPASPTATAGAFHGAELFNIFDFKLPLVAGGSGYENLSNTMGDRWAAFATNGHPNTDGHPNWPAYDPDAPAHMVFNRPDSGVEPCPAQDALDLMRNRIERLDDIVSSKLDLTDSAGRVQSTAPTAGAALFTGVERVE